MTDFAQRFQDAINSSELLVETHTPLDTARTFAESVAAGLSSEPKFVHCRFLYDAIGSQLFEEITRQPDYYPTRTEAAILERSANAIRAITGPRTLVELGSGYSVKTEHLLSAYSRDGAETRYVPIDVSVSALREASRSISGSFPEVNFTGISGTYDSAFHVLHHLSPQMMVFLGSSLGNLNDAESHEFWQSVSTHLPIGDFVLLGVDLVKDAATLEAAYNDSAGVTARFSKNYLTRMNRELGSSIDISQVDHVAEWNPQLDRIETCLRFNTAQTIRLDSIDRVFEIEASERISLEISQKYRLEKLSADLLGHGLKTTKTFTDDREWFGTLLLERCESAPLGESH